MKYFILLFGVLISTLALALSKPSEGEIRKIDLETHKIILRHGAIKNLDMPPMTMLFKVDTTIILDNFKVGDFVYFRADKINNVFTILSLELK